MLYVYFYQTWNQLGQSLSVIQTGFLFPTFSFTFFFTFLFSLHNKKNFFYFLPKGAEKTMNLALLRKKWTEIGWKTEVV